MQLQLDHQHPKQPPAPKKESPKQSPKAVASAESPKAPSKGEMSRVASPKAGKKNQKQEPQEPSIFFNPQLYQETPRNMKLAGFEELKAEAVADLPVFLPKHIMERMRFSEERVYQAVSHTSNDFVAVHMKDHKFGLKFELNQMFEGIHDAVEAGIWDGRYEIDYHRKKYFSHHDKEKELVSYITAEMVRKNIDSFREDLDEELALSTLDQSVHPKSQHHKTKKAEDFVRKMQEEQQRHRERLAERREEQRQMEVRSMQEREMKQQKKQQQRHEWLKDRYRRSLEVMSMEKQRREKMNIEYLKHKSNRKKPLFAMWEERQQELDKESNKKKYKELKKLREQRKPMSFEDLQDHMVRYQELLEEQQSLREQKKELRETEMEVIASKKPYRSKFYSLAVKEATATDPMAELRTSLLLKKFDYAQHVKEHYAPKIDESKQEELQTLMKRITHQRKRGVHSRKYMEEGKRNLQKLHLLMAQMRARNKIKPAQPPPNDSTIQPPPKRYKDYLQDIKGTQKSRTIDFEKGLERHDEQWVRMQAARREAKAKQRQSYLNSALETVDIDTHMQGKGDVEKGYIQSAEAKLALLKKYNALQAEDS